ncbi:MAG: hypothetical protein JWN04_6531 [Myxococcaceae bacterium]|nr:hypothetical protein [Myxococcaceae bacterium]
MAEPRKAEAYLAASIGTLMGHWLTIHCAACASRTDYPLRRLAEQQERAHPLKSVLKRLSCKRCRLRPSRVEITDDVQAGAAGSGTPPSWRVQLLP